MAVGVQCVQVGRVCLLLVSLLRFTTCTAECSTINIPWNSFGEHYWGGNKQIQRQCSQNKHNCHSLNDRVNYNAELTRWPLNAQLEKNQKEESEWWGCSKHVCLGYWGEKVALSMAFILPHVTPFFRGSTRTTVSSTDKQDKSKQKHCSLAMPSFTWQIKIHMVSFNKAT